MITMARDSISGVTRFACTNMGSCSVSAYSIHVTVVGFGSAFVNIWGELGNRLVAFLLSLCDTLSRHIPYLYLSYFHFMGKAWPIKLTFYNVNNFIACDREKGKREGEWAQANNFMYQLVKRIATMEWNPVRVSFVISATWQHEISWMQQASHSKRDSLIEYIYNKKLRKGLKPI